MVTTLLAHGPVDCEVPYQGSVELDRALVAFGGPSQARLILEQGYRHYPEFDYNQVETPIANPVEGLQPWGHVRAGHCCPLRPHRIPTCTPARRQQSTLVALGPDGSAC